ncbi:hypothetical protein GQ457_05G011220 [Hibiscus cannabinus]
MASLLLSFLGFTSQKPCPFTSSLHFRFGAPTGSRFAAPFTMRFRSVKKRNGSIRVSVYSRAFPVVFRDLDADDFRHPLDKQNTLILKATPGLNELGRALLAVLAHELGHLKCDHGVANLLTLGAYIIPRMNLVLSIAQTLEEQLFRWLKAAELTCDRAALLAVLSVLMKLAGGCPSMADD